MPLPGVGIHQDGVLKERTTYEIMSPELIGLPRAIWFWASIPAAMLNERLKELVSA